jgi:hypothetical protein
LIPGFVDAEELSGIGHLIAKKSAASCASTEEIVLSVELFGPRKNGTGTEPFFGVYAEAVD